MNFDEAFPILVQHEGVLSMDPTDPGNWTGGGQGRGELRGTKYGISARSYPTLDIKNLTLDDAKAIYRRDYWDRLRLDDLHTNLRFDLFDLAVNSGVGTAARFLQRAVGAAEDGAIGPVTVAASRSLHPAVITARIAGYRLRLMTDLTIWPQNSRGWAKRVAKNLIDTPA
jgi:lysozyme family protein